ncbi:MAG: ribonuclease II [Pusillimonas sp.]|mgnify:CR=1 FL=1|jgi:exoribonuclease-2|nr:ribonuclease II [Pusillimonas sp.]|tara:strand:+ start:2548 stop:4440 length:1893 start_codon:yes stop_codon:yes gene_type:complete
MYVLYEDSGSFKAEKIFSESDSTMQVESESGKRSKIKNATVLFRFDSPAPAELLQSAQDLAQTFEIDFLWECAPQEEFSAADFAQDYFGHPPTSVEKAALIFALNSAPAYFHRRGKGSYRPAPPEILEAALAAIEKKKRQAEQQQEWTEQLVAGQLPERIGEVASTFLVKPDKNTLEWKAFEAAVKERGTTPEQLLLDVGAWPHPLKLHRDRFFATHFPKGTQFQSADIPELNLELPEANVEAYSIDDITTTEVDDALSVTPLGNDQVQIGIHIAAPGLLVKRDNELDQMARKRMSTVYMPGQKIPMLPDEIIQTFSLDAGQSRPALSLYVTTDLRSGEILETQTRLDRITVKENLRHNWLDADVTEAALEDPSAPLPYAHWLRPLWQFSRHLNAQREALRGKPENNNRVEYMFYLEGEPDDPDSIVKLTPRQRNAPLDRLVAEYMILTNNVWGAFMAQHGVPGIYRSQQAGRVRMSTQALPHEAIGVPQYAWSTSPLRRYVDLVNQGQIIAAAEHGVSARLVAPFKPKEADLFAIIGAFDAQYSAWNEFQSTIERYWCIRWLKQEKLTEVTASVLREDLVRFDCAPFITRIPGLPELERGRRIRLALTGFNELALDVECRYIETLDTEQ